MSEPICSRDIADEEPDRASFEAWDLAARLDCGCYQGRHVGPGCPYYKGGPPKYLVIAIERVTMMHCGVLHMEVSGQWMPLTTPKDFDRLNRMLADYCVDFEKQLESKLVRAEHC